MKNVDMRKVAIIGCGFVGASIAFTLLDSGMFSEMVLIDANTDRAEGEAMDLSHGLAFAKPMNIYAGKYEDLEDAAIIIMTAGANQKPGETRLELVKRNVAIMKSVCAEIKRVEAKGTLLVVANPVDILTSIALNYSGLPAHKILGSGTNLDTARFKQMLGESLNVDPRNVHAYIIGEHGDSEIAIYSSANVGGMSLEDFYNLRGLNEFEKFKADIAHNVKYAAYEVIDRKRATYYAIALSVKRIVTAIMRDEKSVLPISHLMNGEYGIKDVCMSLPTVIGSDGVMGRIIISLDENELMNLQKSATVLKEVLDSSI